jgi:hypothetical protein
MNQGAGNMSMEMEKETAHTGSEDPQHWKNVMILREK